MPSVRQAVRTAGYLFLLFLVDVAANVVADAMALVSRLGASHPKSESPTEKSEHPTSAHAATADGVQILVAVVVVLVCVCATAACVGVWWRGSVLEIIRRRDGFDRVDDGSGGEEDSLVTISLEYSSDEV